jgi:serine/threonine protein kinase
MEPKQEENPPRSSNTLDLLRSLQVDSGDTPFSDGQIPERITIDRYKLLQKIGEGGFGVVYMAEQEKPVRRQVALKIIKLGMDTRQVIARFEAERQALALMDHPNIAKVLDGGATETGRPFYLAAADLVPRGMQRCAACPSKGSHSPRY